MGFQSKANHTKSTPGDVDLQVKEQEDVENGYLYRAREIDEQGRPLDLNGDVYIPGNGVEPSYLDGYYKSALTAALAENGDITFATNSATINSEAGTKNFTIAEMCNAIYRNDSSEVRESFTAPELFCNFILIHSHFSHLLDLKF